MPECYYCKKETEELTSVWLGMVQKCGEYVDRDFKAACTDCLPLLTIEKNQVRKVLEHLLQCLHDFEGPVEDLDPNTLLDQASDPPPHLVKRHLD